MLRLRAKKGWPRALALVLMFAFSLGLLHVHSSGAVASDVAVASVAHDSHDGHQHGDQQAPSMTAHCAFCAVVSGKMYLASDLVTTNAGVGTRVAFWPYKTEPASVAIFDLFRPPIARHI